MFGTHLNLIAPISPSFCRLSCHHPSPSLPATDLLKVASRELIFAAKSHSVSTMATEEENVGNAKQQLAKLFEVSLRRIVPDEQDVAPVIAASTGKFGDYQCNNAMGLWSKIKGKGSEFRGPPSVGQAIMKNLPDSEVIESCSVAGPGFVNVVLSKKWLAKRIQKMLIDGIEKWAPQLPIKRAVVDFSSPNIAKEMHVGHLRSTIIGDTLSRILEFSNVEVLRRNHVGDWGTQFGMLIEFLFEKFPIIEDVNESAIGDLQAFYKASKQRFDDDPAFKERAQRAVVSLQGGEPKYRNAWLKICEIGRKEFHKVYERLGVHLEENGESFYNPYIPEVLKELSDKGLIEESQGARVIFLEGFNIPLIVVKSDGGFNYASTDLAALWYRLNEEKADWIIYVTDVGQQQHFNMFFEAAKCAGWLPTDGALKPKVAYVGFGLVLGEDGKRFRTRSSEVVRLVDLLDEAKDRSKKVLVERGWTEQELNQIAESVGYGAVRVCLVRGMGRNRVGRMRSVPRLVR
ncbi:arginine--tRNA ligase, chloroplastic/mitochondrial-like isoform X3 [Malus sylvestris]|uniref:arginine--tRNA ligase, chloroplastic/mitochondrial-like isoform X3 n=1 Tax=Malus sylvestris TaxID=3752 RepID=UPI0021ACA8E4|nr:arginine--tRNA ligase, chloroplastic/mitochondrial-like isoform X3 [Malus sylvestris]